MSDSPKPIRKAVITAAGFGTRFLPATKNVPKELLPIIKKPTIHYVVEQCVEAGIRDIIIVTRFGNHSVEDYFDTSPILEKYLRDKGKDKEADEIKQIYTMANFIFVRQNPTLPYGNAAPLYSVKDLVSDGPFVYSWGDDFMLGARAGVAEVVELYEEEGGDIILNCTRPDKKEIHKMGMVILKPNSDIVERIVEKPKPDEIVSDVCSVSPYVLTPRIFDYLEPTKVEPGKEFLFQPAIDILTKVGTVRGVVSKGKWLTNGDPLNYLKSTVEIALSNPEFRDDFLTYLKTKTN